MRRTSGRKLQSSTKTLEIVDALVELEGARTTEVAEYTGMSKSTVSNHLYTLQMADFITSRGDEYYPCLKFAAIGEYTQRREPAYETTIKIMRELKEETSFPNSFIVEENGYGRFLTSEVDQPEPYDRYAFVGEREFLHTTAAGKVILAEYPRETVDTIIDQRGLPALTEKTITSREGFYRELEKTKERGYAINDAENYEDVYVLGKAVHRPNGTVLGAITIGSQKSRIRVDRFTERITTLLEEYVNKLEAAL